MHIENTEVLRNWLEKCLVKISNADPAALAKYIIALIKKDKDEKELYPFLLEQLDIFLHEHTKFFIGVLLEALSSNCYTEVNFDNNMDKYLHPLSEAQGISEAAMEIKKPESVSGDNVSAEKGELIPSTKSFLAVGKRIKAGPNEDAPSKKLKFEEKTKVSTDKISKRCKDYDEQGYCLKGHGCLYDHGSDPVIVEDCSLLNFNVNSSISFGDHVNSHSSEILPPLLPPLPTSSPPPLPPLPPLPSPSAYVPEAYNPESPGMNSSTNDYQPSYFTHSRMNTHPSLHNHIKQKPTMIRELIGIPTEFGNLNINKRERQALPDLTDRSRESYFTPLKPSEIEQTAAKVPVYSRLGPNTKRTTAAESRGTSLLLKKVPKDLNTIETINRHFSNFGTVTNIECNYGGDPEAALVKFQKFSEASAAYKSSLAIMNNRFIKVFYHNLVKNTNPEPVKTNSETTKPGNYQKVNYSEKFMNTQSVHSQRMTVNNLEDKKREMPVTYPSRNSLTRTIFNPAPFVKKKVLKTQKEEKKDTLQKRLMLNRKEQMLLESELKHQKLILDKLKSTKNLKEKESLKKVLFDLSKIIGNLSSDSKKRNEELAKLMIKETSSKNVTEKALLDAEIELYKQENSLQENSDTTSLLARVNELKQKAKALGLLHPSPPKEKYSSGFSLKKDNRTCTLSIYTDNSEIKEEALKSHFSKFGDIEKIESKSGFFNVCFTSRKAAEMAFSNGKQLGNTILTLSWFENHNVPVETSNGDTTEAQVKSDNIDFADEDEEEEDNESRSWRR